MTDEIDRFIRECLADPRPYNAKQIAHLNNARKKAIAVRLSRKMTREEKSALQKEKRDIARENKVADQVADLDDYAYDESLADPPTIIVQPEPRPVVPEHDRCVDCFRAIDRSRSNRNCHVCLERDRARKKKRKKKAEG